MKIEDKIKYIEAGLGFDFTYYGDNISIEAIICSCMLKRSLITEKVKDKLLLISKQCNFKDNYLSKKPLNNQSILFINLVYEILKKTKINERICNKTRRTL